MAGANTNELQEAFSRMSARERKLVIVTALAAAIFVLGGIGLWTNSALSSREKRVQLRKEQLAQILAYEGRYKDAERKEKRSAERLKRNTITLFSHLNKGAQELGLSLNDLNERKKPLRDTGIEQISVDVNLKKVSIDLLGKFLEKIESKSSRGLVKILKLKVTTRHDNPELLDVKMTVATWKAAS